MGKSNGQNKMVTDCETWKGTEKFNVFTFSLYTGSIRILELVSTNLKELKNQSTSKGLILL